MQFLKSGKLLSLLVEFYFFNSGTLTTNRMTVVECYLAGKYWNKGLPKAEELPDSLVKNLVTGISVNSAYTSKITVSYHSL